MPFAKLGKRKRSGSTYGRHVSKFTKYGAVAHRFGSAAIKKIATRYGGKKRGPGSKTKTKKRKSMIADDLHSGISSSVIKVVLNKKPIKNAKGGNIQLQQSYQARVNSSAGLQVGQDILNIGTAQQWNVSTGSAYANYQSYLQYFDVNPNRITTGSSLYGAVLPLDDRLALVRSEVELMVGNLENLGTFVDIYFCRCKKDTPAGPYLSWTDGLVADALGIGALTLTAAGAVTGQIGRGTATLVGSKPQDVKMFSDFWKVVKVRSLKLGAGACEKIKVDVIHNQLGKREVQLESTLLYLKGQLSIMVVQHGATVMDKTGAGSNPIVPGATEVGFNMFCKHHFKPVYGNAARLNNKVAVTNTAAGSALAAQILDNIIDSGAAGVLSGTVMAAL